MQFHQMHEWRMPLTYNEELGALNGGHAPCEATQGSVRRLRSAEPLSDLPRGHGRRIKRADAQVRPQAVPV